MIAAVAAFISTCCARPTCPPKPLMARQDFGQTLFLPRLRARDPTVCRARCWWWTGNACAYRCVPRLLLQQGDDHGLNEARQTPRNPTAKFKAKLITKLPAAMTRLPRGFAQSGKVRAGCTQGRPTRRPKTPKTSKRAEDIGKSTSKGEDPGDRPGERTASRRVHVRPYSTRGHNTACRTNTIESYQQQPDEPCDGSPSSRPIDDHRHPEGRHRSQCADANKPMNGQKDGHSAAGHSTPQKHWQKKRRQNVSAQRSEIRTRPPSTHSQVSDPESKG
jgi:hypothetical protein